MFDTERLIAEVHKWSCIWKTDDSTYTDKAARRAAWHHIAEAMQAHYPTYPQHKKQQCVEDLGKKWRNVRDYYSREKKNKRYTPCGNSGSKRKYSYFDRLKFLDDQNTLGSDAGSVSTDILRPHVSVIEEPTAYSYEDSRTVEDESLDPIPGSSFIDDALPSTVRPRQQSSEVSEFQQHLLRMVGDAMASSHQTDEDKSFLLSLVSEMKLLDRRQKLNFKLEVLNALKRIQCQTVKRNS